MALASFIDANVPVYAAGRPHPLKAPCAEVLLLISQRPLAFITSAEVLQELLHRYLALRRWAEGRHSLARFATVMHDRIEPIYAADVVRAADLADTYPELGGRDLLHAAVMQRLGLSRIISADRGFDRIAGVERLDPANLSDWRDSLAL